MAYDPKNPPSLLANGIGGATGLRHFAYKSNTDSVATVLGAGYFTNARKLGMRVGDALMFTDPANDRHHLQVGAIDELTGFGTVEFPLTSPLSVPTGTLEDIALKPATVVGFQDGRQFQMPIEEASATLIPVVSRDQAEAGDYNLGRMTPLRSRQSEQYILHMPQAEGAVPGGLVDASAALTAALTSFGTVLVQDDFLINQNWVQPAGTHIAFRGGRLIIGATVATVDLRGTYDSDGGAVIVRNNPATVISGLYVKDVFFTKPAKRAGQRGLEFGPRYVLPNGIMASPAATYSTGTSRILQEIGVPFIKVTYTGAFGEVRAQLVAEDGSTVIASQTVTMAGAASSVQADKLVPFSGDAVAKTYLFFFPDLDVRTAGPSARMRVNFNPSAGYQISTFQVSELLYGFLNDRHVKYTDPSSDLGLKIYTIRDGNTSAVWIKDADEGAIKEDIDRLVQQGCTGVRIPAWYKGCVNADGSLNQTYMSRLERVLAYLDKCNLRVILSLNHPTGPDYAATGVGLHDDIIVYIADIDTLAKRQALAVRAGIFAKSLASHPSIAMIELQNEVNIMMPTTGSSSVIWDNVRDYIQRIGAAVKANSKFRTSLSFSGARSQMEGAFAAFAADVLDHHMYGSDFDGCMPVAKTLIGTECETLADLREMQKFLQSYGPWWSFADPSHSAYVADMTAAFVAAYPGENQLVIPAFTGVFAENILSLSQLGSEIRQAKRWNRPSGGNGLWENDGTAWVELSRPRATLTGSLVWDPGALANGTGETSSEITVTGAVFGDSVRVAPPYDLQGLVAFGYINIANKVKIRLQNGVGGTVDLGSGTWTVYVDKAG